MNKISTANWTTNSSLDIIKNSELLEFREHLVKKTLSMITWANMGTHNKTEPFITEILQMVGFYYKFKYLLQVFQNGPNSIWMTLIDFGSLQMFFKVENDSGIIEAYQKLIELKDMKNDGQEFL